MSHSVVLVIGKDWEEQLAPFYEQGDINDSFMEKQIEVEADEMELKGKELVGKFMLQAIDEAKKNIEILERKEGEISPYEINTRGTENVIKTLKNLKKENYTAICQDWQGGELDSDGNLYTLSNLNARWDWYQLGGRWSGFFKLKAGATGEKGEHRAKQFDPETPDLPEDVVDQAKKGDIDWKGMKADRTKIAKATWKKYQTALTKGEVKEGDAYWTYGIEEGDSEASYIRKQSSLATFAVLLNGEWYEKGEMGWWGVVRNGKEDEVWDAEFNKLVAGLSEDEILSVVDVHI